MYAILIKLAPILVDCVSHANRMQWDFRGGNILLRREIEKDFRGEVTYESSPEK